MHPQTILSLIELADKRMYEMKKEHHGRKEMEHEMEEVNANA